MLHAKYIIYLTWTFWFKKNGRLFLYRTHATIWKSLLATLLKLKKEKWSSVTFIQCSPDWMKLLITSRGFEQRTKSKRKQTNTKQLHILLFSAIRTQLAGIVALAPSFLFHCAKGEISPSTITLDGQYHSFWLLRKKTWVVLKDLLVTDHFCLHKALRKGLWLFSHSCDLWRTTASMIHTSPVTNNRTRAFSAWPFVPGLD